MGKCVIQLKRKRGRQIFMPGLEAISRDACITRYDTGVNLWSVLFLLIMQYVLSDLPDNKEENKVRIKEKRNTSSSFFSLLFMVQIFPGNKCMRQSKNNTNNINIPC